MKTLLDLNVRALNQYYVVQQGDELIHERKEGEDNSGPQSFKFGIHKGIEKQIEDFQSVMYKGGWNGRLEFDGFKGGFKLEYWSIFEEAFRSLDTVSLKKIVFTNTKLGGDHLNMLLSLILWVKPKELSLEFKQNELDDKDLEEFIDKVLYRFPKMIYSFEVISNPGSFKGNLLQLVKSKLGQLTEFTEFNYLFYKNKENKSFAFIRLKKQTSQENIDKLITQFNNKIKESFYYKLSFRNSFTESNYQGLYYLLEQTYHNDKLEQLEYLDITGCKIQEPAKFKALCERISTSKGLLHLGIGSMPIFNDDSIVQTLMGDRYDQLRLNHLDISDQQDITEKCMQIFADNLIAPSLKSVNLNNSMGQSIPVLVKMMYICNAFEKEINNLKVLSQQSGKIMRLKMKKLDLSKLENYNRHDLAERFADCLIFNEYSNIRRLVLQNYDAGRIEAVIKSCQKFKKHIQLMQKANPQLYQSFKPKLWSITLPNQIYAMQSEPYAKFFEEIAFTKIGDILEIKEFIMVECFGIEARREGLRIFLQNLEKTYETSPDVKYNLKSIKLEDCQLYSQDIWKNLFGLIVFNNHFQIEELKLQNQQVYYDEWLECPLNYLNQLEPNQFCFLKKLHFNKVSGVSIEIFKFLDIFVYNPKFRIEELELDQIELKDEDNEVKEKFIEETKNFDKPLSLKKLKLGNIYSPNINKTLFEYLVFTKISSLENLEILCLDLTNIIYYLYDRVIQLEYQGYMVLSTLISFTFQFNDDYTENEWQKFCEIFIWNKRIKLKSLKFKSLNISKEFQSGFQNSYVNSYEIITDDQQLMEKFKFHLKELIFEDCNFEVSILYIFFTSLMCRIEKFSLINCRNVENAFEKLQDQLESSEKSNIQFKNILTLSLTELILDNTEFNDIKLFEWFIRNIVMEKDRQRICKISFQDCNLQNNYMEIINTVLKELKDYQLKENFQRYFSMRDFNFNNNPDISTQQWKMFANNLFSVYEEYSADESENKNQHDKDKDDNNIDYINQEMLEQKENISEETSQVLYTQKLNIEKKILDNPSLFELSPPKQLKIVEISLKFENEQLETKKDLYLRIVKGLIFFPGSQVEEVFLREVNMQILTDSINNGFKYIFQYNERSQKDHCNFMLNKLSLSDITEDTQENIEILVRQFFKNTYINLKSFIINSILNQNILKKIITVTQENIKDGRQILLEELVLQGVKENLSQEETLQFLQTLVINEKVPLKILSLGGDINLQPSDDLKSELKIYIQNLKNKLELRELKMEFFDNYTPETYKIILPFLFNSQCSQLEKLIITQNKAYDDILENVFQEDQVNITTLKQIQIPDIQINIKFFEFIYKLRPQLQKATFHQLTLGEWNTDEIQILDEFLNEKAQNQEKFDNCIFEFSVSQSNIDKFAPEIMNKFVFHPVFQWNSVSTSHDNNISLFNKFENVIFQDKYQHLQVLKLYMDLVYTDYQQLSEAGLELIGKCLIYNEYSNLKELWFHQCQLKPAGMKKLTAPAQEFREKIAQEKREKKAQLKLERFSIYYSLYIGQEGFELMSNDIIFFEYITIKKIELEVLNLNEDNQLAFNQAARNWLKFQIQKRRPSSQSFQIEYLDLGRNEFVQSKKVWDEICDLFIFTDLTPKLKDLYIHFMSLQDIQVEYISEKARSFFMWKPYDYVFPLRRLNFSLNTALSHLGWKKILKRFFFEKHVRLEELNLISTMIDSELKINAILNVMKQRALTEKNQKLPLHTLYCYNISIKSNIFSYLSDRPADYKSNLHECILEFDDNDSTNMGNINGIPVSFGQLQSIINKTIYQSKQYYNLNQISEESSVRFSPYHLDLVQGFLKPLNNLFKQQSQLQFSLPINYKTIDQLCALFQYRRFEGDPYPLQIFFDQKSIDFYNSKECQIQEIKFIGVNLKTQEIVTQEHVLEFWEFVKSNENSLNSIEIDYKCDDDLVDLMFSKGYSERDFVDLIRLFPPTSIRFQKILTLQAIKGIYSVMWDNNNFQYSNILVDKDIFLNMGIGYSLREYVYSSNPKYIILRCFKRVFYWFFDLFVSQVQAYEFSEQVKDLNKYLANKNFTFIYFIFLTLIFYAVCICAPLLFTYYSNKTYSDICYKGVSQYALYTYFAFAVLFLVSEFLLFRQITKIIPKHLNIEDENQQQNRYRNKITKVEIEKIDKTVIDLEKQKIKKHSTTEKFLESFDQLQQSKTVRKTQIYIALLFSQLAKYNLYNQVSFILTCYYCMEEYLFYAALTVGSINTLIEFYTLINLIILRIFKGNNKAKQLSTKYINDFFVVSTIGRNIAIAQVLDQVAPYNITVLPNNFISKTLMPQLAGKSISNSVRGYLLKFTFEDMPLIILQIIFLIIISSKPQPGKSNNSGDISIFSIITIANSSFSLFLSFIKFMSIRPSSLSQLDFDKLANQKKKNNLAIQINDLNKESEIIKALTYQQDKEIILLNQDEEVTNLLIQ